eukprot:TRINITY_DN1914_c0_g2_i1.p1 TRINITY_DN1914_c0_g2~~TRINITY_DN1914_c0_g2_i1.p1  ORF type:complete len:555 (-),score=85.83 TRINITY_DN1914_c0_g2_i1:127-1791(-)
MDRSKRKGAELAGPGTLTVSVIEARHLAGGETSNPFCKVYCDCSTQSFTTPTQRKTSSPLWEEEFYIYIGQLESNMKVQIKVYSESLIKEFLGEVTIVLEKLIEAPGDAMGGWYNLVNEPQVTDKTPGQIYLRLHFPKGLTDGGQLKCDEPTKYYTFEGQLGVGAFGLVRLCTHKTSKKQYAIKIITKQKMNRRQTELLQREISVMSKLHHPNIVDLIEAYDTTTSTYLVLEYVDGGSILKELMEHGPYTEKESARLMRQLIESILYMNSRGVAHRDLKPDNLLITRDRTLKVSDFGLSKDYSEGSALVTSVGTACYVAPEVLSGKKYTTACDIWSCGVITYILLSAQMPFHGPNNDIIFEKIRVADYVFPSPYFDHVSVEALDFIDKILVPNVKHRMIIDQCLLHSWLRKWHPDLQKRYLDSNLTLSSTSDKKKGKKSSQKRPEPGEDRTKYTQKPVAASAVDCNTKPEKDSVATPNYGDEDDYSFPPIVATAEPVVEPKVPEPGLVEPHQIEMSVIHPSGDALPPSKPVVETEGDREGRKKVGDNFSGFKNV